MILPDHDPTGRAHALQVAMSLYSDADVKVLELPGLPEKGDVTDWLNAGGSTEQLKALIETAPAWEPNWPKLQPLTKHPDVMPFDVGWLPDSFQTYVADIADRMQCPLDFPAVALMVCFGGLIGRRLAIRPKQYDNWTEIPNLWGAIVAPPSRLKTPALAEPKSMLTRLEAEAAQDYQTAREQWEKLLLVNEEKSKLDKQAIKKKLKEGHSATEIADELLEADESATGPIRRRFLTSDATAEKLHEILTVNTHITLFRDELMGWIAGLDKAGRESERQFFLEGWNGSGEMDIDRITRGSLHSEGICISVLGGIQPGPLKKHLVESARQGATDDGLIQHFSLMVYPDDQEKWQNVDRYPDTDAKTAVWELFERFQEIDHATLGAEIDPFDRKQTPFLRFNSEAQTRFNQWRMNLEILLRSEDLPEILQSHLGKYRGLVPQLALLIHLAERGTGPAPLSALEKAIRWSEYLRTHAERIYAPANSAEHEDALYLLNWIQRGGHRRFSIRDCRQITKRRFSTVSDLEPAIRFLEEHGYLLLVPQKQKGTGQPPSPEYLVRPSTFCEDTVKKRPQNPQKSTFEGNRSSSGDSGDAFQGRFSKNDSLLTVGDVEFF